MPPDSTRRTDARTSVAILRATLAIAVASLFPGAILAESTCFGTVAKGRLENGVALPSSGPNFSSYSAAAEFVGRTYVHSRVREVVVDSYKALEAAAPGKVFVFGETGWKSGGRIKPHRTPTSPLNRFGYDIEFDAAGRYEDLEIDFPAVAEHLYQLHATARALGIGIGLVIFDETYLPRLFATARGPYLKQNLRFMKGKPWVRHDEHYHVDFAVRCKPFAGYSALVSDV